MAAGMSYTPGYFGKDFEERPDLGPIRITLTIEGGVAVIRADKGSDVTVVPLKVLVEEAKTQLEWAVKRAVPQ